MTNEITRTGLCEVRYIIEQARSMGMTGRYNLNWSSNGNGTYTATIRWSN